MTVAAMDLYVFDGDQCPHCRGDRLVFPDDIPTALHVVEPCPMCSGGRVASSEYALGVVASPRRITKLSESEAVMAPRSAFPAKAVNRDGIKVPRPDYYHDVDMGRHSWNRGLTVRHRFRCAVEGCWQVVDARNVPCAGCQARWAKGRDAA